MRGMGFERVIGMLVVLASSATISMAQPTAKPGQQIRQMQADPRYPIVLEDCVSLYKERTQARLDCDERNAGKKRGKAR